MAHDPPGTNEKINQERIDSEFLRNKLKLRNFEVKSSFNQKYPHVNKILSKRGLSLERLRKHSANVVAAGALTGSLLFSPPVLSGNLPNPTEIIKSLAKIDSDDSSSNSVSLNQKLITKIKEFLPQIVGPLTRSQEKNLEKVLEDILGINTKATLEGEHLNTTYGYIGAEQHLKRYPGDNISQHDLTSDDEGIAPGLGAWGYFTQSRSDMTQTDVEREKWYAVVQTLYLPDWSSRLNYLRDWYKYRKVLIVNTVNGNAVVAAIADSGPAAFTGKQFGGSPEVMNYLGGSRYKKGPVLVFFVDDPENKVPLGPVEYNNIDIPKGSLVGV